jgi:hypothetical protein
MGERRRGYTAEDIRILVNDELANVTLSAYAEQHGVSRSHLCDFLMGRKETPPAGILRYLGLRREVRVLFVPERAA